MSHPSSSPTPADSAEEPVITVHDKRRFTEEGEPKQAEPTVDPEVERLTRELAAARDRVNQLAYAVQAGDKDREEFKARLTRERDRMLDVERGKVALALLEAVDELDFCLRNVEDSPLVQGVRMVRDGLLKKAEANGIERVELQGQPFDPNLAEASDMEITSVEGDDGRVTAVMRACYRLHGRVVRPGQVKVARYVKPASA